MWNFSMISIKTELGCAFQKQGPSNNQLRNQTKKPSAFVGREKPLLALSSTALLNVEGSGKINTSSHPSQGGVLRGKDSTVFHKAPEAISLGYS